MERQVETTPRSVPSLRLLVVDEDVVALAATARLLEAAGHRVERASGGAAARELLEARPRFWFDLLLLSLRMADVSGLDVLEGLRSRGDDAAVILLTASEDDMDRAAALRQGADDVVSRPLAPDELTARVEAVTRRRLQLPTVRCGELVVDLGRLLVLLEGRRVELSPQEFAVLRTLLEARGAWLSATDLLAAAWDDAHPTSSTLVPVTVRRLRQRLGPRGARLIESQRGRGYRLVDREPWP